MNKINKEIINDLIENTLKKMKERKLEINKNVTEQEKNPENEERNALRRKIEKKEQKKMLMNQIIMEEDLPFEKEIRKINEKKRKEREEKAKRENDEMKFNKLRSKMSKAMIDRQKEEKYKELANQEIIADALSFMTDLSLSNVDQSFAQFKDANMNLQYLGENKFTYEDGAIDIIFAKDKKSFVVKENEQESEFIRK